MFGEVWGPETHSRRRKLIIQKHPEVAQLLKPTKPYSIILTFFTVFIGLAVCYFVKVLTSIIQDASWPVFLFVTYWVGGTIGHSLHVLIHDFTHYGGHSSITVNKFFAIMCNIPMGIPSAIPFGKHHADHHNFLGEERKDPDLPMRAESKASQYFLYKIFFWIFLTLFYALRPMFFSKNARFNRDEIINIIVIACTDLIIYKYWGANALLYLLLVAFVSIGPHPAAAHTLAEHYEFVKGQETYDYFGFWNFFNLNLGYHIEHHDFPTCPWYNLPKVRAAAP